MKSKDKDQDKHQEELEKTSEKKIVSMSIAIF
jgi:hypothetical protein